MKLEAMQIVFKVLCWPLASNASHFWLLRNHSSAKSIKKADSVLAQLGVRGRSGKTINEF